MTVTFPPTRTAALERLRDFAPQTGRAYAARRNYAVPGHAGVSRLSPYIRHRVLTEAEVAQAAVGRGAAEKFIQEVCWRSYWKGWLERRPSVWADYQRGVIAAQDQLAVQSGLRAGWEAACAGQTGIDGFDAWAQELVATGYMHNHARMWFASIWIFTLRLPWELGADFFLRHLLDGDPASNTLSWRWVAGLHTAGKTYAARPDNVATYTEGAHRPSGLLPADQVAPIGPHMLPALGPAPQDSDFDPSLRSGLLLSEDDMSPGYLFARGLTPVAGAVLTQVAGRSPLLVAPQAHDFTAALMADTTARFADRVPGGFAPPTDDIAQITAWAKDAGLQQIVTPYAPTGPVKSALDALEQQVDIPLIRPLRRWDQIAFPKATAGFFKFKAVIPALLDSLGAA